MGCGIGCSGSPPAQGAVLVVIPGFEILGVQRAAGGSLRIGGQMKHIGIGIARFGGYLYRQGAGAGAVAGKHRICHLCHSQIAGCRHGLRDGYVAGPRRNLHAVLILPRNQQNVA
ncbi:hypothetical protein D3C75_852040 [compost metagenome]